MTLRIMLIIPHVLTSTAPTSAERSASEVIPWLILFIGMVLAGGVLIFYLRRWMKGDGISGGEVGFTLQDLREMHARGDLSDAEFQSARAAMIGRIAAEKSAVAITDPAAEDSD